MTAPAYPYRHYVTIRSTVIWWELYRVRAGQFELCWEFVGLITLPKQL